MARTRPPWLAAVAVAALAALVSAQPPPTPPLVKLTLPRPARPLWVDCTSVTIGETAEWTNKVELADINDDGLVDILFANGGNYDTPGDPELNRVFLNRGRDRSFEEVTEDVFGPTPDLARVIKVRDVNGDLLPDIFVGTTFQTQSRLYLSVGHGTFTEATSTHLPQVAASIGDVEFGDADEDGDLDLVLADWGPGSPMENAGGRTMLWLNDGRGHFTDATRTNMPDVLVQFSWDLEFVDVDNDFDLDALVSCKRCGGGELFLNDGHGRFERTLRRMPAYTNNYDFEPIDLDGDGFLDLVTINDGEIVGGDFVNRREHVFVNDGRGVFIDRTPQLWPDKQNPGEDDNVVAVLDYDSDGDADFLIGSLTGPDRLMVNEGKGRLRMVRDHVLEGPATPGTLAMAVADLDGDHRLDVVQAQGEHKTAVEEKVYLAGKVPVDAAPPIVSIERTPASRPDGSLVVRARIHDNKSPSMPHDWRSVLVHWTDPSGEAHDIPMQWYGEHLWRAIGALPAARSIRWEVCAVDAAGNRRCSASSPGAAR